MSQWRSSVNLHNWNTLEDHWKTTRRPLEAHWLSPVAFQCTLGSKFQVHWIATWRPLAQGEGCIRTYCTTTSTHIIVSSATANQLLIIHSSDNNKMKNKCSYSMVIKGEAQIGQNIPGKHCICSMISNKSAWYWLIAMCKQTHSTLVWYEGTDSAK